MARTRSVTVALRSGVSEATLSNNVKMRASKSYALSLEDWGRISGTARTTKIDVPTLNTNAAIIAEFDGTNFAKDLTSATFHNTVALPPIYSGSTTLEKLGAAKYGLDGSLYKLVLLTDDGTLGNVNSTTTKNVAVWVDRSEFTVSVKTSAAGNATAAFAGVMIAATTAGRYGWMQIAGDVDAAAANSGVTVGDAVIVSRSTDGVFTSALGDESVSLDLTGLPDYGHINEEQTFEFGIAQGASSDPGAENEVKILTVTGGAEADLFTLTIGANKSANIVMPAGGFANLTAATIDTAMAGGTLGYANADVVVTGATGGPFTFTFGGALVATNIGNMTLTDATGAAAGTILDDGTGASVQGTANGGTFTLTFNGGPLGAGDHVSGAIAFDASAATVQTAVDTIAWDSGPATTVVTKVGQGSYAVEFVGVLGGGGGTPNVAELTSSSSLTGPDAPYTITHATFPQGSASDDSFTLTLGGQTTPSLVYATPAVDVTAANIQAELEALSTVGVGNVTVTGTDNVGPFTITFGGALSGEDVGALTMTPTGFTGGTITTTAGGSASSGVVGSALSTSSVTKSDVAIRNTGAVNLGRRERNLFLGRRA